MRGVGHVAKCMLMCMHGSYRLHYLKDLLYARVISYVYLVLYVYRVSYAYLVSYIPTYL